MGELVRATGLETNFYTFEGTVRALNGVSIVVNPGETYALVGESGCGKSVTVRSLMRIVQAPGRIDSGKILLFLHGEGEKAGVEILGRSEAYMESIRGNDLSMIFQEPGAALNPVLSVGEQVGESFLFHRMPQMLEDALASVGEGRGAPAGAWKRMQRSLFRRELAALRRAEERVKAIDAELSGFQDDGNAAATARREHLNRARESVRGASALVETARRVPLLRRYRRPMRRAIERHVVDLLRDLGIPNPENIARRYPHELSGGMQQRIVIAMALACHPTLLIADEPTSNLDVTIQAQIIDLIKDLKRTKITSVLFITHDLGLVAEMCDRVSVMYAGDVGETASVRELFRGPLHPYSQGLLASVPKIEQVQELTMIPGSVPNLIAPPPGCRFHPRCPNVMEVCSRQKPPLLEHSKDHWVACHLYRKKEPRDG
jgi:peptide/nickel transport system ATP-binding protein